MIDIERERGRKLTFDVLLAHRVNVANSARVYTRMAVQLASGNAHYSH